jgi:hypothetical protein
MGPNDGGRRFVRICSLETEFGLVSNLIAHSLRTRDQVADLLEDAIMQQHRWVRCNSFGRAQRSERSRNMVKIREGEFIENGSRIYYDTGHFEWANPEAIEPYAVVLYEKATESNLVDALELVNQQAKAISPDGWVMLVKNNIDYTGDITYGCHENYSLFNAGNKNKDVFSRLVDDLVPFLVTRQIFTGAGRVGTRTAKPDDPAAFQLAQRSDFIETVSSVKTREDRSLINMRDEPLTTLPHLRRLHLILGDSNMSEWSTYLKVGTTALVLSAIEENLIGGHWRLSDPISALHQISRRWRDTRISLRAGGKATALKIQFEYWNIVAKMCVELPDKHYAHQIVRAWRETLEDLDDLSPRLARRLDWAIKENALFKPVLKSANTDWDEVGIWSYVIRQTLRIACPPEDANVLDWLGQYLSSQELAQIKSYVNSHHLDWKNYLPQRKILGRLWEMDLRYHDLSPQNGFYAYLDQSEQIDHLIMDGSTVVMAKRQPPANTRAWERGQLIEKCGGQSSNLEMDWDKMLVLDSQTKVELPNPFQAEQIPLAIKQRLMSLQAGPVGTKASKPVQGMPGSISNFQVKVIKVDTLRKD